MTRGSARKPKLVSAARLIQRSRSAEVEGRAEEDWSETWKAHVRSVTAGRLWVGPPWEKERAPPELIRVVIEPGMAFGTGDHPTTRFCLEALDEVLARKPGARLLDVGTGSGVLAIAGSKLGASKIVGVDIKASEELRLAG